MKNCLNILQQIYNLGKKYCFWGFNDGTFNATCQTVVDQEKFYFGHKQKHVNKYQSVVTSNSLVSSRIDSFIGQ